MAGFQVAGALGGGLFIECQSTRGLAVAGEEISGGFLHGSVLRCQRQGFFNAGADGGEVLFVGVAIIQRIGIPGRRDKGEPIRRILGRRAQGLVDYGLGTITVLIREVQADEVIHRWGVTGEFG